jgi:hypothetical protein
LIIEALAINMDSKFTANKVTCEINTEEGYYLAGFSDNGEDPDQYVILQQAISFDEQDAGLEMDTCYFEYSGQSNSGYGICKNAVIEDGRVFLN